MRRLACFVVAGRVFLLSGCATVPPAPPSPPERATAGIGAAARARTEGIRTLRAGVELVWVDPGTGEPESCTGSLTYERPGQLRLHARTAAFFTAFELVAGPEQVWLDVPREDLTAIGSRDDPDWDRLPVSPEPLLVALLADPCPIEPCWDAVRIVEGEDDPVMHGPGWTLTVDAGSRLPKTLRRGELTITWTEWIERRGIPWAHKIRVQGPEGTLEARLGRLVVDRSLHGTPFRFDPADSRRILTPAEVSEHWEARRSTD